MTIEITGKSDLERAQRAEAVKAILELETKELKNLSALAKSKSARSYLSEPKFTALRAML